MSTITFATISYSTPQTVASLLTHQYSNRLEYWMCYSAGMVRLNKNILEQNQIDGLFLQLAKVVSPSDSAHSNLILSELLGNEERIMLAKRLAVVILLAEDTSRYKISRILKLSESTVNDISKKIEQGHFDTVLKKVSRTKKDYFILLKALDSILYLGGILPHYNGLDRYKSIR